MAYNQEIFEKCEEFHRHSFLLEEHIRRSENTFLAPNGATLVIFDPKDEIHTTNFNMFDQIMISLDDNEELFELYMALIYAIEDEQYEDAIAIKNKIQEF